MVALSAVLGRQFKGSGIVGFGLLPFIGQSGQAVQNGGKVRHQIGRAHV